MTHPLDPPLKRGMTPKSAISPNFNPSSHNHCRKSLHLREPVPTFGREDIEVCIFKKHKIHTNFNCSKFSKKALLSVTATFVLFLALSCVGNKKYDYSSQVNSVNFYEGYSVDEMAKSFFKMNSLIKDSIYKQHIIDSLSTNKKSLMDLANDPYYDEHYREYPLFVILNPNINPYSGKFRRSIVIGTIQSKDTNTLNNYYNRKVIRDLFPADFKYKYISIPQTNDLSWVVGLKSHQSKSLMRESIKSFQFIKSNMFGRIFQYLMDVKYGRKYYPLLILEKSAENNLDSGKQYLIDLKYKNFDFYKILDNGITNDSILFNIKVKEGEFSKENKTSLN